MTVFRTAMTPGAVAAVSACFLAAGCASGAQSAERPAERVAQVVTVEVTPSGFQPSNLKLGHGDVLRFVQRDDTPHNVAFFWTPAAARMVPEHVPSLVDEGGPERFPPLRVGPQFLWHGDAYDLVIDEHFASGIYEFGCTSPGHDWMRGMLLVSDAPGTR